MTLEEKMTKLFGKNEAVKSAYRKLRLDEGMEDAVNILGVQKGFKLYLNRFKKFAQTDIKKASWMQSNQINKYTVMLEKKFSI
jgi:hypothetical protein